MLTVLFFLGLGLVQVYSSSFIFAIESLGDGHYFFKKQLVFVAFSFCAFVAAYMIPEKHIEKVGIALWCLACLSLFLTLVPAFSIKAGGAQRWLKLPFGQRFEPAELVKCTLPFLVASFVSRPFRTQKYLPWAIFALIITPVFVIFLKQPDFGSFTICLFIFFAVLFSFGLDWRYLASAGVIAVPAFYFLVVRVPYRYARITAFLDPWADPAKKGFQIIQSMLSFYSGGVSGVGLGQGQGKLFFLPEAHTDFALSVLAEEMGFVGVSFVLLLYGFIILKGFQIVLKAKNNYQIALALGLTCAFTFSVLINIGVTMGLLPPKGLSLPFLSYGGSSLFTTCMSIGFLLNIEKNNLMGVQREKFTGFKIL